jgi:hypothetical protein
MIWLGKLDMGQGKQNGSLGVHDQNGGFFYGGGNDPKMANHWQ